MRATIESAHPLNFSEIRDGWDLFFTSQGVVLLTVVTFLGLLVYSIIVPAGMHEKEVTLLQQWHAHRRRFRRGEAPCRDTGEGKKDQ